MKIMNSAIGWLVLAGVYEKEKGSLYWIRFKRLYNLFFTIFTVWPCMLFIAKNKDNYFKVAQTLYSVFMFTGLFIQLLTLIKHRNKLKLCLDNVENVVNHLIRVKKTNIFEKLESRLTTYIRIFAWFTNSSVALYCSAPAMLMANAYFNNKVTNTTYEAPFHDTYIIETKDNILFYICYGLYSLGVVSIGITFLTKNFLFVSSCWYMVALFAELKAMFGTIDDQSTEVDRIRVLKKCVQFHKLVISYILTLNTVFNTIIFVQLVYSLGTLAMLVFTATYVDFAHLSVLLMNSVCLFGELFMFCFAGTLVLEESSKLSYCIYCLRWYEYSSSEMKLFQVIMMRLRRPSGFSAFNYFECNLFTFQYIMNKVFAAFTCLQGMA